MTNYPITRPQFLPSQPCRTSPSVERARTHGATDREIHDTVLIAAAFCLFNRYVDGLATWAPDDPAMYRQRATLACENGYAAANPYPVFEPVSPDQP